jgi:hypothetical protein
MEKRIDEQYQKALSNVRLLRQAVTRANDSDIANAVGDIVAQMIEEMPQFSASTLSASQRERNNLLRKQHRELFVAFGGMQPLMKLLSPPFVPLDGRSISTNRMSQKSEYFNEIFVIFRELLLSVPALADNFFTGQHLVFFFTLLSHSGIFENVMNILEELLATREDTFSLASIPRFYELVRGLSARHLAHFCRVLSLLIFEPEDRQIMEGTHVLRSVELLALRRNRMSRTSVGMVERNQNLVRNVVFLLFPFVVNF